MKNFFALMWRKGWKFILILIIIWLIYFLITFFYPKAFDFVRNKQIENSQTSESSDLETKPPLRLRIYNTLFNNPALKGLTGLNNASGTEISTKNKEPYIWGSEDGSTQRNKNFLKAEDLYVFPNTKVNAVAQNFRFDDVLVKENSENILKDGTIITGEINTHYLSTPFFTIDIYDAEGAFLYAISASGRILEDNENLIAFSAINIASYNFSQYKGEGFLVIWTDNLDVESVLISQITIE